MGEPPRRCQRIKSRWVSGGWKSASATTATGRSTRQKKAPTRRRRSRRCSRVCGGLAMRLKYGGSRTCRHAQTVFPTHREPNAHRSWRLRSGAWAHYICGSGDLQALPIVCRSKNHCARYVPCSPVSEVQSVLARHRPSCTAARLLSARSQSREFIGSPTRLGLHRAPILTLCISVHCRISTLPASSAAPASKLRDHGLGKIPVRPTQARDQ